MPRRRSCRRAIDGAERVGGLESQRSLRGERRGAAKARRHGPGFDSERTRRGPTPGYRFPDAPSPVVIRQRRAVSTLSQAPPGRLGFCCVWGTLGSVFLSLSSREAGMVGTGQPEINPVSQGFARRGRPPVDSEFLPHPAESQGIVPDESRPATQQAAWEKASAPFETTRPSSGDLVRPPGLQAGEWRVSLRRSWACPSGKGVALESQRPLVALPVE